jgi:DNA-binding SARP family transcriptional activator
VARRDGLPLPIGSGKPRELLAALLLHRNQPVTTEQLVEMLWPDARPDEPAKTVHVYVSRLRRALTDPILQTEGAAYVLQVRPEQLDVDRFAALVDAGRERLGADDPRAASRLLEEALALWRAEDALTELRYAAFAQPDIEQLAERRLEASELALEAELALGRHAAAVPRLKGLVDRHPLRERLHGYLMLALYRCGRQAEALAAYRRLRDTLDAELAQPPSAELRRLEQQILQQDPGLDGAGPATAPPAPPTSAGDRVPLPPPLERARQSPLVGREDELAAIADAAGALGGARRLVLLSGDAGIGKTRLLAEAAARLQADGWPVLFGRADEEGLIPYEPFVEALRHYLVFRPDLGLAPGERLPAAAAPLAMLVPELEPLLSEERPPLWEDAEAGRYRLFVAFASVLSRIAEREQLALVLDDLQWADGATLRLVRELVTRSGSAELIVLGAYRDAPHEPLVRLQEALSRDHRLDEIAVGGLAEADVAALAVAAGGDPPAAVVRELHQATRGYPFLVEQLLPLLATADDSSFASEYAAMKVPSAIRIVVQRRLQALPIDVVRTLSAAAVLGREFRLADLEAIVPPELLPVLPRLEDALAAGLIEEVGDEVDRFAFAHDLLRRTLYEELSESRAARLHLDAARVLERAGRDVSELVHHYVAAQEIGGAADAAVTSIQLAQRLAAAHAHADAVRQYRTALAALGFVEPDAGATLRCEALVGLAASLDTLDIDEARAAYAEAAAVADAAGLPAWLGRAAIGFARWQRYARVDDEAVALLEHALAALPETDSDVRAQVLGLLGVRLGPADQERRERLWRDGVAMARRDGDDAALATILRYAPYALWRPESLPERLAAADETVALATAADQSLWGQVNAFAERLELGDVADADRALEAARALAERSRHRWFQWYLPMLLATRALLGDDVDEGEWLARSALESRLEVEPGATEVFAAQLALCARLRGTADEPVLAQLDDQVARFPDRTLWRALLADALLTAGRDEEARPLLQSVLADELPANPDRLAVLALSVEAAARLGEIDAAAKRVDALIPFAGRLILVDRAWAVWGPTARVLGIAHAARGDATAAAEYFGQAEQQLAAIGAGAWLAVTRAERPAAGAERRSARSA